MSNEELTNEEPRHKKILNTSGKGKEALVPESVAKRFNWGVFCFGWIWGLFNKSWITTIDFVLWIISIIQVNSHSLAQIGPSTLFLTVLSIGLRIWFGIKGNTWAWQNKKWKNIEHFHKIQKRWAIAGLIILLFFMLIPFFIGLMLGLAGFALPH